MSSLAQEIIYLQAAVLPTIPFSLLTTVEIHQVYLQYQSQHTLSKMMGLILTPATPAEATTTSAASAPPSPVEASPPRRRRSRQPAAAPPSPTREAGPPPPPTTTYHAPGRGRSASCPPSPPGTQTFRCDNPQHTANPTIVVAETAAQPAPEAAPGCEYLTPEERWWNLERLNCASCLLEAALGDEDPIDGEKYPGAVAVGREICVNLGLR